MTGWRFLLRVIVKAAVLFVARQPGLRAARSDRGAGARLALQRHPAGARALPYGENPSESYNLSLYSVPAMFASHVVARAKPADEYRVLLIGDSSTWGWFLQPGETYAANINAANLTSADGRRIVAYNLGYPIMSLTKDLLLLDERHAVPARPDRLAGDAGVVPAR